MRSELTSSPASFASCFSLMAVDIPARLTSVMTALVMITTLHQASKFDVHLRAGKYTRQRACRAASYNADIALVCISLHFDSLPSGQRCCLTSVISRSYRKLLWNWVPWVVLSGLHCVMCCHGIQFWVGTEQPWKKIEIQYSISLAKKSTWGQAKGKTVGY